MAWIKSSIDCILPPLSAPLLSSLANRSVEQMLKRDPRGVEAAANLHIREIATLVTCPYFHYGKIPPVHRHKQSPIPTPFGPQLATNHLCGTAKGYSKLGQAIHKPAPITLGLIGPILSRVTQFMLVPKQQWPSTINGAVPLAAGRGRTARKTHFRSFACLWSTLLPGACPPSFDVACRAAGYVCVPARRVRRGPSIKQRHVSHMRLT